VVVFVWESTRKMKLTTLQRKASNVMVGVVFVQFLLGIITLLFSVPVVMGVLHQTGAFVLFASALFFMHSLKREV
jgi:cytochrome c oxidase assembly protein subunit 15